MLTTVLLVVLTADLVMRRGSAAMAWVKSKV
jgi:hypothetical protein